MIDSITDKINFLRAKVRDGGELTKDEAREALDFMREARKGVLDKAAAKEAKKAPINLQDLFN